MFTFAYAKSLLILGVVLLLSGSVTIGVLRSFPFVETVYQTTIDMTTTGWYDSEGFRAESGYWLNLDISSSGSSIVYVVGQTVGEIFKVEGSTYSYTIAISEGDVYRVKIQNKEGHYEFIFFWTPHENHYSGNFYLQRTPAYYFYLMYLGVITFLVGLLIVPAVLFLEYRTRLRAKSVYDCPRCGKEVMRGWEKCPYCKIDLTKYWIKCKYCNKLYDSHYDKCPRCGAISD